MEPKGVAADVSCYRGTSAGFIPCIPILDMLDSTRETPLFNVLCDKILHKILLEQEWAPGQPVCSNDVSRSL